MIRKLSSTDAFVAVDIADAPATGIVRCARKILQGGANDLARSGSYTFASFEMQRSGASGGINAEGDDVAGAIGAFVEELTPAVADGELHLEAAKGVDPDAFAPLSAAAGRNSAVASLEATVASVVSATRWALDGLDGRSVAIEGAGPIPSALRAALAVAGATVVEVDGVADKPWMIWGAEADALLAGSKAGTLTHQGAPMVKAKAVVPWGPIPVTAKAFAQLRRADVTVVPDFVSAGGGLIAGYLEGDEAAVKADIDRQVAAVLAEAGSHDEGVLLGACHRAEAFLATWTDERLFGRPLAA